MSLVADVAAIQHIHLFSNIKPEHLQFIAFIAEKKHCKTGETIIQKGDPPVHAHIILDGVIDITRDQEEVLRLPVKQKPILIGDVALFAQTPYRFSAQIAAPTTLMQLKKKDLIRFIQEFPECGRQIYQVMQQRFQAMMTDLDKLGTILQA